MPLSRLDAHSICATRITPNESKNGRKGCLKKNITQRGKSKRWKQEGCAAAQGKDKIKIAAYPCRVYCHISSTLASDIDAFFANPSIFFFFTPPLCHAENKLVHDSSSGMRRERTRHLRCFDAGVVLVEGRETKVTPPSGLCGGTPPTLSGSGSAPKCSPGQPPSCPATAQAKDSHPSQLNRNQASSRPYLISHENGTGDSGRVASGGGQRTAQLLSRLASSKKQKKKRNNLIGTGEKQKTSHRKRRTRGEASIS